MQKGETLTVELLRVPLLLLVFGGLGAVIFGFALRNLKRDDAHPTLERVEWISPVRGRWLRYLLMAVVIPLLAASIVALGIGDLVLLLVFATAGGQSR
jgi:L-cystine uptake protein TcyP (sodium:dicarboxylate symporter family)